jgi:DNA (cytosine-5)-methyltransferase 1
VEDDVSKPKLLDLFCGAGGAAVGYDCAGFEVTGVDINRQKNFPFEFIQGDALEYVSEHGNEYDAIHASPPCQGYSVSKHLGNGKHPLLIESVRDLLIESQKPYVIENVVGAPLINPTTLCGAMFDLLVYRHRLFETSFPLLAPYHPKHVIKQAKMGRPVNDGEIISVVGHFSNVPYARMAMGIWWMTGKELCQAIPPAYTHWIGKQLKWII